jgi:hypothetical protein
MPPRVARLTLTAAFTLVALHPIADVSAAAASDNPAAAPTTTAAAPTTAAAASTTVAPSTTAAAPTTTGVTTTTEAGPPPRSSQRVAVPSVDIEKIRPTELPVRTIGFVTAIGIAVLAVAGFVYGKVRSRIPAPATPRPTPAQESNESSGDAPPPDSPPVMPPPTPLPPPQAAPLPPPEAVNEWAPPKG